MTSFERFARNANYTMAVILADLDKLQAIGDEVNKREGDLYPAPPTTKRAEFIETESRESAPNEQMDDEKNFPFFVDESRLTIPMAMVCFSAIDLFGQWVLGRSSNNFAEAADTFFKVLANRDDLKNNESKIIFMDIHRHGVTHTFFSKKYGVAYWKASYGCLLRERSLDVQYLIDVIRTGFKRLKQSIQDKDPIANTAFKGYLEWQLKELNNSH